MWKRRYEILLPLKFNDGQPVPAEALNQTREELLARFDGLTVHPHSLLGIWQQEGQRYEDELIRLTVDVDDSEEEGSASRTLSAGRDLHRLSSD